MWNASLKVLAAGSAAALLASAALAQQPAPSPTTPDPQQQIDTLPAPPAGETPQADQPPATEERTEQSPAATDGVAFLASQEATELLIEDLKGVPVRSPHGESLGHISTMVIDENGAVSAVLIRVGGFLGIGGKQIGVAYDDLQFSMEGLEGEAGRRVVTLRADAAALEGAPQYQTIADQEAARRMQEQAPAQPDRSSALDGTPERQ